MFCAVIREIRLQPRGRKYPFLLCAIFCALTACDRSTEHSGPTTPVEINNLIFVLPTDRIDQLASSKLILPSGVTRETPIIRLKYENPDFYLVHDRRIARKTSIDGETPYIWQISSAKGEDVVEYDGVTFVCAERLPNRTSCGFRLEIFGEPWAAYAHNDDLETLLAATEKAKLEIVKLSTRR